MLDVIWLNLVELSKLDVFSMLLDKVNIKHHVDRGRFCFNEKNRALCALIFSALQAAHSLRELEAFGHLGSPPMVPSPTPDNPPCSPHPPLTTPMVPSLA